MTDPNWVLIEARNAISDFRDATSIPELERAASVLADTFEALDKWLCEGGFLPADWLPATNAIAILKAKIEGKDVTDE